MLKPQQLTGRVQPKRGQRQQMHAHVSANAYTTLYRSSGNHLMSCCRTLVT